MAPNFFPAKLDGRRHLVCQMPDGSIGASPSFNPGEARRNAVNRPVAPQPTLEDTFKALLRQRGFIVREGAMDDRLAGAVERMLFA